MALKHSTIRPVTLTQLLAVEHLGDDVPLRLDGADLHRVKFIASITDKPPVVNSTCSMYIFQDALSSASIGVLLYNLADSESEEEVDDLSGDSSVQKAATKKPPLSPAVFEPDVYYACFGALRLLKKQRGAPKTNVHVELHGWRKLTDMNELTFHGLEVVHTHLGFTRK